MVTLLLSPKPSAAIIVLRDTADDLRGLPDVDFLVAAAFASPALARAVTLRSASVGFSAAAAQAGAARTVAAVKNIKPPASIIE